MKLIRRFGFTILLVVLALIAAQWVWRVYMTAPWTRDGKIDADIVNVSADIAGKVIDVAVKDNQLVHKGDVLFIIDPEPYQMALDSAKAALKQAKAKEDKTSHIAKRRKEMPKGTIAIEDVDEAIHDVIAARASVAEARSAVDQARWNLTKSQVTAPVDGFITNLKVKNGHYTHVGDTLVALIDRNSYYVTGYFEETKLHHITIGDKAEIHLVSNDTSYSGSVESLGRGISDTSLTEDNTPLPAVESNIPWIQLAQRVPVRIKFDQIPPAEFMIVGTSCSVMVKQ